LAKLLHSKDDDVVGHVCRTLSFLSNDHSPKNQQIQAVVQSGISRRIVELLLHKNLNIKTAALKTVGHIATGDDAQTQALVQCSVLPCLLALLTHPSKEIRKEACWTISNITAGTQQQIQGKKPKKRILLVFFLMSFPPSSMMK
jgi:importin subunit alpha-1